MTLHPSTEAILKHFEYAHLPPKLQAVSKPFCDLARAMAGMSSESEMPLLDVRGNPLSGPELTAGLRKLLEAKDCAVRAAL